MENEALFKPENPKEKKKIILNGQIYGSPHNTIILLLIKEQIGTSVRTLSLNTQQYLFLFKV